MSQSPSQEALRAARRAVARIRSFGIDGPRPIDEIEALGEHEAELDAALREVVSSAGPDDLAAALHLVALMPRPSLADVVLEIAFERPADFEAKREAVNALRRCGVEPGDGITEKLARLEALAEAPSSDSLAELLEWTMPWREPALDRWLAAADESLLSSVEIAIGIQPELDARLLDWIASLGSSEAGEVLLRFLQQAEDKDRIKQVKRALHRLRSQGVEIDESPVGPDAGGFSLTIDSDALQDARAYVTSVDGRGARLVWLLWRVPSGGSRLLQAVIDDVAGVREADVATVTRQGFREYVEQMKENPTVLLQQAPVERATDLLAAAAAVTREAGNTPPADYERWAEAIGLEPRVAGEPGIYEHLGGVEVGGDEALIDAAMTQLREPHFQSWAMEGATIDDAADQIQQAETSTLMVSDEQRQERMQDAIRQAVSTVFDGDTRRLYRSRLEVMAEMLWDGGQTEEAKQLLAAAVGLTETDDLFRGHAFARALVHRGVWLAYQDKQRELQAEEQRSRIVKP